MFLRKIQPFIKSNQIQNLAFPLANLRQIIVSKYSTENDSNPPKKENVSKAMKAYLARAKEYEEFMEKEQREYQLGKRHLANMMGEDPDTFTQDDIDNAIRYLFPSGLYEKKARPIMKPPDVIFPPKKAAEFDITGRPYHFLFYTGRPNFYKVLHDVVGEIKKLNKHEDQMLRENKQPDPNLKLNLSGHQWFDKLTLEEKLVETISDREYENFISAMESLSSMTYSYLAKDLVYNYRKPLMSQASTTEAPKPKTDEDGREYITVYECMRKDARGTVTIRSPGTGKITINNNDITYFKDVQSREQLLFPLIFTNMQGKVDIEAVVEGGGYSGQAGAIRWGIAWGLKSFVDQETVDNMRIAGLLTRDHRRRERMKPGQQGARRKFTWKKR